MGSPVRGGGPAKIARVASELGCHSVAFTYNDPVIFHEYAIDIAAACHERGVRTVAVTAGYIQPEPRVEFFAAMDAANVDLKAFRDETYRQYVGARLQPVLDSLRTISDETNRHIRSDRNDREKPHQPVRR